MEARSRKVWQGVAIGLGGAIAVGTLTLLGGLETLELWSLDLRFRAVPRRPPPDGVAIVAIDQGSLEYANAAIRQRWPWPREIYAKLIDFLAAGGARAVVFDIFFTEPDLNRDEYEVGQTDAALAAASAASGRTYHSYILRTLGEAPSADEFAALTNGLPPGWLTSAPSAPQPEVFGTVALPEARLTQSSRLTGFATIFPERDNIFRRVPMLAAVSNQPLPSLAFATAWDLAGRPPVRREPGRLAFGATSVPVDGRGRALLWWYRPAGTNRTSFATYAAADVLRAAIQRERGRAPDLPPTVFSNQVVVLGSTAPGLFDLRATPLAEVTPGVEIQATALANLLRGEFVTRAGRGLVLALLAAVCLGVGLACSRGLKHVVFGVSLTVAVLLAIGLGGTWGLARGRYFLDVVPLFTGALVTFLSSTYVNYLSERRQSRLVRNIFEHYLDRAIVHTLIANPDQVKLGGERRECTVLFTDVANFTNLSEKLDPEHVVQIMNHYLNAMTELVIAEGGFVDKFVGDEIVAIFGAPSDQPDHAARACRTLLRMAERLREMQAEFRDLGCDHELFARSGLSTGEVIVGNMGSDERMNYTAMGDVMNLGARLEGANKAYGTRVLVSAPTARAAGDAFWFREVDLVRVKGKDLPTPVFELVGDAAGVPEGRRAVLTEFGRGLALYRAGTWDEAVACFEKAERAGDPAAAVFVARCRQLAATPPASWDGVYVLPSK